MNIIKITPENASNYGPGTKVEFNFGAYYPVAEGTVSRIEIVAASKYFPAAARLWAEYVDQEGEAVETTISMFSDKGIGTRLIEAVPHNMKNPASVWAEK